MQQPLVSVEQNERLQVLKAACLYSICSSSLLALNKLVLGFFPVSCFVLLIQLVSSSAVVIVLRTSRIITLDLGKDTKRKLYYYCLISFSFVLGVYSNFRALQVVNVETIIVCRACTPLCVSFIEALFLNREYPCRQSLVSLFVIAVGAIWYVQCDLHFSSVGYFWLSVWFVVLIFGFTYVKHVCEVIHTSTWEQVFLTNSIGSVPLGAVFYFSGESAQLRLCTWNARSVAALLLSCLLGLGISQSAYDLRQRISATSFDVVGICCKFGTILLNMLLGLKTASISASAALCMCLLSSYFYKQAPFRKQSPLSSS
jgi:GDP-mannose transporter